MVITVKIRPNSKHREEVVLSGEIVEVYVKAPAIEGRANEAAQKVLAKHYGVSLSCVTLVRGATSKFKVFEIQGAAK